MLKLASLLKCLQLAALILLSAVCSAWAQTSPKVTDDALTALVLSGWDSQCGDRGCIMFRDVPIGDLTHPFDANDPQFLTIAVAIERQTKKIAYISFKAPSDSDTSKPLLVNFIKADPASGFKIVAETEPIALRYEARCNNNSCDVRIAGGLVQPSADSQKVDVFDLMMTNTFIKFAVTRRGITQTPIESLLKFQEDYKALLGKELAK